jgi:hypothetical protein
VNRRSTTASSRTTGSSPFFWALLKKMSAKEGAITTRMT